MTPTDVIAALMTPVHSINVIGFARLPATGAATAVVCFHKRRQRNWFNRWFLSEYQHMHLVVVKVVNLATWQPCGPLLNEIDAIIPKEVQNRLDLEFLQSEKDCPMPDPATMADCLAEIVSRGWGSLEVSEFADLVLSDPHLGPAFKAYAKGVK